MEKKKKRRIIIIITAAALIFLIVFSMWFYIVSACFRVKSREIYIPFGPSLHHVHEFRGISDDYEYFEYKLSGRQTEKLLAGKFGKEKTITLSEDNIEEISYYIEDSIVIPYGHTVRYLQDFPLLYLFDETAKRYYIIYKDI